MKLWEYGDIGYIHRLEGTLQLLASLKAVVGFVNEEMLPGYRTEVLHEGEEGREMRGTSELGMIVSTSWHEWKRKVQSLPHLILAAAPSHMYRIRWTGHCIAQSRSLCATGTGPISDLPDRALGKKCSWRV